jgi:ABC-type multidrug transport system permease subunit
MPAMSGDRNRAVLLALIVTFVALVFGRILFGFFWVVALGAAVVLFTTAFAFFLRIQRNRR